ncbi:MAG: hypothetical protein HRU34_04450 [Richelia sp.]|nr:hypothetical protein [Richelia sp.]
MSDIQKGSVYGAIEPLVTNIDGERYKLTDSTRNKLSQFDCEHHYSDPLQRLLEQRPSILAYSLLISSTLFLSILIILVWGMRVVDAYYVLGLKTDKVTTQYTSSLVNKSEIKKL